MKKIYPPLLIFTLLLSCGKVKIPTNKLLLHGNNHREEIIITGIPDTFELIQDKIQLTKWSELPKNGYAGFIHLPTGKKIFISANLIPSKWSYIQAIDSAYSGELKRDELQRLNNSSFYSRYFSVTKSKTIYDLRKVNIFHENIMFEINMTSRFFNSNNPYQYDITQDDFIKKIHLASKKI